MNPQRAVVARQSMSASLQNLRDRIHDERARIERAFKNPGAVPIPKSSSEPTTPLKLSSEVIELPRQEPKKEAASELMQQGRLAAEFQLSVPSSTVLTVAQKSDLKNASAAWYTCAPSKAPYHASQANLTLIRQLAASRALSMIVKTGGTGIPVISPNQNVWVQKLNPAHNASISAKLASTSLQTIPPRSSHLLSSLKTSTIEQPIAMKLAVQSSSTPNIAAAITASGSSRQSRLSLSPLSEGSTDDPFNEDDWSMSDDEDEFLPGRSDTPPLPSANLVSV